MRFSLTPKEVHTLIRALTATAEEQNDCHDSECEDHDAPLAAACRALIERLASACRALLESKATPRHRCPECGSSSIDVAEWVDPNDGNRLIGGDAPISEPVWCHRCVRHYDTYCTSTRARGVSGPCTMHGYKAGESCRPPRTCSGDHPKADGCPVCDTKEA